VLHVLVGLKFGEIVVLRLPEVTLPSWAAGIQVGGTVYLEGLLAAAHRCRQRAREPETAVARPSRRPPRDRFGRGGVGVGRPPARGERAAGPAGATASR
jgi:hypothetical protein